MSVYAIADIDVKDKETFKEYARGVPATLEKYGGRYIVRGGKVQGIEGDWKPRLLVMIEFPTMEALQKWYDSDDYKPLLEMRMRSTHTNAVVVEGV